MFKRIVWATDGSESADYALESVKMLASEAGAKVIVVHTVEYSGGGRAAPLPIRADEDGLQAKIEQQVTELAEQGVDASAKIVYSGIGGAAHPIADIASEEGADLIVAGTR